MSASANGVRSIPHTMNPNFPPRSVEGAFRSQLCRRLANPIVPACERHWCRHHVKVMIGTKAFATCGCDARVAASSLKDNSPLTRTRHDRNRSRRPPSEITLTQPHALRVPLRVKMSLCILRFRHPRTFKKNAFCRNEHVKLNALDTTRMKDRLREHGAPHCVREIPPSIPSELCSRSGALSRRDETIHRERKVSSAARASRL